MSIESITANRRLFGALTLLIATFGQGTALHAIQPSVEIRAEYAEYFVNEPIFLRISVANVSNEPISILRIDRLPQYNVAAMFPEVFDPFGKLFSRGTGTTLGDRIAALGPLEGDLVEVAGHQRVEGKTYLTGVHPDQPGKFRVHLTYHPQLKKGPEIVRDISVTLIPFDQAVEQVQAVPKKGEVRRYTSEIVKVRTVDGHWLFAKTAPEGRLTRLAQVNEKTTFRVSEPQGVGSPEGGEIVVTHLTDGEEQEFRVNYLNGVPIQSR